MDRLLAVWYLMRHVDSVGSGRVLKWKLKDFVKRERLMSQETLRQRLLEGEGQFWNTKTVGEKEVIGYRSLKRVSEILGVVPSKAVMIPLWAFSRVAKIRAYFYSSLFAGKTNPISRETIAKTWQIPKSTQRRYERLAGGAGCLYLPSREQVVLVLRSTELLSNRLGDRTTRDNQAGKEGVAGSSRGEGNR
jgi:hypothetical protein